MPREGNGVAHARFPPQCIRVAERANDTLRMCSMSVRRVARVWSDGHVGAVCEPTPAPF
ncbi:hypothetical protein B0H19DRAFT_1097246, partial [Mycena capillaripes]